MSTAATRIVHRIYQHFIQLSGKRGIPIVLRSKVAPSSQDDPFHAWIETQIRLALPGIEVFQSGSLTTPDIVMRDPADGTIVAIESKKLVQRPNGTDSRGLTLDYNSSLPCGSTVIKVGVESVIVPCYYLFALLSEDSRLILTLILMDGDFLNHDFELHRTSKFANISEYSHGPYGEGSVRHRKMYNYPNPLNTKLPTFAGKRIMVSKKHEIEQLRLENEATHLIVREDTSSHKFHYLLLDRESNSKEKISVVEDIFAACKVRSPKDRTPSAPTIPPLNIG